AQGLKKHTKRLNAPTPKSLESWCFCYLAVDLAQNIQNSHRIAMMEVVKGGKDLNVSVTMPAIEATIGILTRSETTSIREDTEIIERRTFKGSKQTESYRYFH
ncbi:hydroxymethylglutaryl-CoA reductase, class I/II, partial [Tanacetum coccineum]